MVDRRLKRKCKKQCMAEEVRVRKPNQLSINHSDHHKAKWKSHLKNKGMYFSLYCKLNGVNVLILKC